MRLGSAVFGDDHAVVMAIVNRTPDSFYDRGATFATDAALGMIEIGTITGEAYRGRGYAALTCAQLIRECEARGYRTYWNCAKDNQASAGLARRLGYQTEQEFRYVVWSPPDR